MGSWRSKLPNTAPSLLYGNGPPCLIKRTVSRPSFRRSASVTSVSLVFWGSRANVGAPASCKISEVIRMNQSLFIGFERVLPSPLMKATVKEASFQLPRRHATKSSPQNHECFDNGREQPMLARMHTIEVASTVFIGCNPGVLLGASYCKFRC